MKEPRKSSIGELFAGDTQYVIPRYQRNFDWKSESQVSDLMSDLISTTESNANDNLYLGAMIFDVSEHKAKTTIEVIDGQLETYYNNAAVNGHARLRALGVEG